MSTRTDIVRYCNGCGTEETECKLLYHGGDYHLCDDCLQRGWVFCDHCQRIHHNDAITIGNIEFAWCEAYKRKGNQS